METGGQAPQLQAARLRQNRPQLCGRGRSLLGRPDQRSCVRVQSHFIQGHLGVVRSIASGESLVTFDTIASISMDQKNQGLTQAVAFSQDDSLPIWPYTAAIFKAAPHPNAAKLFLSWYLSPEQQAKTGNWSSRSDVPPPYGWKPILSYKVVNNYREFLTNTIQLAELRKRFEVYTGPVKNTGGVR